MSRKVTVRLATGRAGRPRGLAGGAGVASLAPVAPGSPPLEKVPRVARVLALAHHWPGLLRSGAVRDQAHLARLVGVSRARVTQVMALLWLAPGIQARVLDGGMEPPDGQRALRALAALPRWAHQRLAHGSLHEGTAFP